MEGCEVRGCWKDIHQRDDALDLVVGITTIGLLLIGVAISYFSSGGCMSSFVIPDDNDAKNAYDRATVVFSRLFQRPESARSKSISEAAWCAPEPKIVRAEAHRTRRLLADSTLIMDLSHETNIIYSGNTLNNNIIAQKDHLEYDFGSSSELETLAKQLIQLKASFLPTIFESTSRDSYTSLSFMEQEERRRRQTRRAIVLFTGPEDQRHWLQEEEEEDSPSPTKRTAHSQDFLWVFEDVNSDEEADSHFRHHK